MNDSIKQYYVNWDCFSKYDECLGSVGVAVVKIVCVLRASSDIIFCHLWGLLFTRNWNYKSNFISRVESMNKTKLTKTGWLMELMNNWCSHMAGLAWMNPLNTVASFSGGPINAQVMKLFLCFVASNERFFFYRTARIASLINSEHSTEQSMRMNRCRNISNAFSVAVFLAGCHSSLL